jgi:AcrR family transcriptional regulator
MAVHRSTAEIRGSAVTDQLDRRADGTRLQILLAASHEFARKPYSQVSLDDILAQAEVTKGAMYFHFRSKHELALAIIEHQNLLGHVSMTEVIARRLSGLETLVDISCLFVARDIGDDLGRAGLNLLESIGRADGVQARVLGEWVKAFAEVIQRATAEGDVLADRDPEDVGRLLVSAFVGLRQVSDINDAQRYFTELEKTWAFTLPGFASPDRIPYLKQFIKRRIALAISNSTPLGP